MEDENYDPLTKSSRAAAEYAINNLESFELLASILWCRIANVFQTYLIEILEEVHMTNNFARATTKDNELFVTNEYRSDVISAFNIGQWSGIDSGQRSLAVQMVFHMQELFLAEAGKYVPKKKNAKNMLKTRGRSCLF